MPAFAEYLLNERLAEFVRVQIALSREVNVPLLKYFSSLTEEQLIALSTKSTTEFFNYIIQNKAKEQIEISLNNWVSNSLPLIDKDQVAGDDIALINYVRKNTFLKFIPSFTSELSVALTIVDEIDRYILASEAASFNEYIRLQQKKINEHLHFIEKITHTSPSIIYVYDELAQKEIYSNKRIEEFIGYTKEDLQQFNASIAIHLIHPDDLPKVIEHTKALYKSKDGEICTIECRIKDKQNNYRWMRAYESVFKRNEEGKVWQKIGTAIDIHNEKIMAEALGHREQQLLEAQELADMGSFEWDFNTHDIEATPQLMRILGLKELGNSELFFQNVHPADREKVKQAIEKAIQHNEIYECEYRYNSDGKEKIIWSRGVIITEGIRKLMRGTLMDVTERHQLIRKLQRSDELFKQSQALTHIGNWSWEVASGKLTWSDELYRIYGLQPQSEEITFKRFMGFVHPAFRKKREEQIQEMLINLQKTEYTLPIVLGDGKEKMIQGFSEVLLDEEGKPFKILGTCQDITEKQSIIAKLEESQRLYKQAATIAKMGNWTWDLETNRIEWSDELYEMFDMDPQSQPIDYALYTSFIHPDDIDHARTSVEEAFSTLRLDYNYRSILRNGKEKVIHSMAQVKTDGNGKPILFIGTAQDVTEQFYIEKQLREKQAFIQQITDATPSMIASYNVNTKKYTFVNKGFNKLLGFEQEVLLQGGDNFFIDIMHPDDRDEVIKRHTNAIEMANAKGLAESEIILEILYRMKAKSGEYRWFQTYATILDRNENGNVEHVLNISLDVTEKIVAEQKVQEQDYFIKHIADASPTVLYLFNAEEGKIIYINKEVEYILGYSINEIIEMEDKVINLLYHPEDIREIRNRLDKYKQNATGNLFQFECRMKHKNGEWRWLLIREIIFKHNAAGRILQIVGAALDITERKNTENNLFQKTLELQQSNASLAEFAYVASHDLKEPLRKISTFGERLTLSQMHLLQDDGKLYLKKITDASRRMQVLIDDLLTVSMIAAQKTFEKYSLQKILDESLQTLEDKVEETHALITCDQLPEANIVTSQFRQLFQNLLSNSLKFSVNAKRPVINISHSYVLYKEVAQHPQLAFTSRYLKLVFTDNGIGFEPEYAEKIFNIFQRLHSRSEYEGTGIGLSICKKVVENHGGIIYANAANKDGAEFVIILPSV